MNDAHSYVVILAGGGGTRLWPHSRRSRPKQFLPMLPGGETLIGATARRTSDVVPIARTLVVTTAEQVPELRRCLPDLPIDNILVEPTGRNTAPCIGLAAMVLWKRDPQAVMAVLPSDHYVANEAGFRATLTEALAVAHAGHVVTLGILPTHPETGYGYIELGPELDGQRVLGAETVAEMSRNQVGPIRAGYMGSAMPDFAPPYDAFPDQHTGWGLGFLINPETGPNGRSPGSLHWAGIFNSYYWIDPAKGVGGVFMSQLQPFGDPGALACFGALERMAYA